MRYLIIAIATFFIAGAASAADWTTEDGGSAKCSVVNQDGTCWLSAISEDSSAITVSKCAKWVITVYGTGASVMPQACTTKACAAAEDLLASVLTGDSPDTYLASTYGWDYVRIDWTSGNPTISIKCGR